MCVMRVMCVMRFMCVMCVMCVMCGRCVWGGQEGHQSHSYNQAITPAKKVENLSQKDSNLGKTAASHITLLHSCVTHYSPPQLRHTLLSSTAASHITLLHNCVTHYSPPQLRHTLLSFHT